MPLAVVQPENLVSVGAATAIIDALEELGGEWETSFEGPRTTPGVEYRSRYGMEPDWSTVVAQVTVVLAREAIRLALAAISAGAEKWLESRRGATVEIIVVERETGERTHAIRIPGRRG